MIVEKESEPEFWTVSPTPGYLIKFKEVDVSFGLPSLSDERRKAFINLCHCTQLPPPGDDLNEDELASLLDGGGSLRVPLCIGEVDCVRDKKNENSIKLDVLVNSSFFESRLASLTSRFYRHYITMVICEAIENKHSLKLDAGKAIVLQNRTHIGELEMQRINRRPTSKPQIEELAKEEKTAEKEEKEECRIGDTSRVDVEGLSMRLVQGERLEMRMGLDKVDGGVHSIKRLRLRLTRDRCCLLLDGRRSLYDYCVPFQMDATKATSRLDREKQALLVTVPIFFP